VNWLCDIGRTDYPAIADDGTVYVLNGDLPSAYYRCFIALNPDGSFKWASKRYNQPGRSPVVGSDGTVYCAVFSAADSMLVALNPDGTERWTYDVAQPYPFGDPAIGADGTIYFTQYSSSVLESHKLIALNPNGTLKWEYYAGGYIFGSTVTVDADGTVYAGIRNTYSLYAINADGSLKWTFDDPHADVGPVAIGADGTLYFGVDDGSIYAVGPGAG
jgi:outer membrane protein assembly factor BamB